ncbi:MAG: DHH family phosphoesterase, partial [Planctomycetia bacterium]
MKRIWRIHHHDAGRVSDLSRSARIKPFLAQLLLARGITNPDQVQPFLNPKLTMLRDPNELPGCTDAAKQILDAAQAGKRIVIYGDYDADGVTATAILWQCLKLLDANVGYHIPHRVEEGYGLNDEVLRRLFDKSSAQPAELIVTVDCGITSTKEAETVRELGGEL